MLCGACGFNTQPPEGGCQAGCFAAIEAMVSTHSRPKAAAQEGDFFAIWTVVSTHSRPKAAACAPRWPPAPLPWFQHTAARRRLHAQRTARCFSRTFQHTAARRRLPAHAIDDVGDVKVSTHSRPKAAARKAPRCVGLLQVSTHSRPKAAAAAFWLRGVCFVCFNTQPPEGGCPAASMPLQNVGVSTHSRPKAAARRPMARPE